MTMQKITIELTHKQYLLLQRSLSLLSGPHVSETHPEQSGELQELLFDAVVRAYAPPTCSAADLASGLSSCNDSIRPHRPEEDDLHAHV